tara:strand:+ start:467 stop:568 length:102 start_codon:yes stop_codon:yes gene_type:complete
LSLVVAVVVEVVLGEQDHLIALQQGQEDKVILW